MKKLLIVISLFILIKNVNSQDVIKMRIGLEIKSKIINIDEKNIYYKDYNDSTGTTKTVKLRDVIAVKYNDGTYSTKNDLYKKIRPKDSEKGGKYLLGIGGGISYGGVGFKHTVTTKGKNRVGVHFGTGFIPDKDVNKKIGINGGILFYLFDYLHLDLSYGLVAIDNFYKQGFIYDYYDNEYREYYYTEYRIVNGTSLHLGYDLMGSRIGLNISLGPSFVEETGKFHFTTNLGLIIK